MLPLFNFFTAIHRRLTSVSDCTNGKGSATSLRSTIDSSSSVSDVSPSDTRRGPVGVIFLRHCGRTVKVV